MNDTPWNDLTAGARAGDQAAARQLVEALYPQVIGIIRNHLPRAADEQDMAQEVFLKMFQRLGQFNGTAPFPHWVSKIAVSTCLDHLRAQKRRPEYRFADLSENESELIQNTLMSTDAGAASQSQAREMVELLLARLDADDEVLVRMLDLEQKSLSEVSDILGVPVTVVKVRAFRARRKLKKMLGHVRW